MDIYKGIILGAWAAWLPYCDWDAAYKLVHPGVVRVNGTYYKAHAGAKPISVKWPDGTIHKADAAPGMIVWEAVK